MCVSVCVWHVNARVASIVPQHVELILFLQFKSFYFFILLCWSGVGLEGGVLPQQLRAGRSGHLPPGRA